MKQLLCIALFICIATSQSFSQSTTLSKFVALSVPDDERWNPDSANLNANGTVYTIGLGDNYGSCYVGGHFDTIGGVPAKNLAFFEDGFPESFTEVGGGVKGGDVRSIIRLLDNELYIGGSFNQVGDSTANSVAHWKDSKWETMEGGVDGIVYSLALVGNFVYVGGAFKHAGSVEAHNIARYSILGKSWSPIIDNGFNGVNDTVRTIALSSSGGSEIYIGGNFTRAGSIVANKIARYDGMWTDLQGGVNDSNGYVSVISTHGGLYIGGKFNSVGGVSVNNIAYTNGTNWMELSEFPGGFDGPVYAISNMRFGLYVGGDFHKAGDSICNFIAKKNQPNTTLGSGLNGPCYTIDGRFIVTAFQGNYSNHLYVGGKFTQAGQKTSQNFAIWGEYGGGSVATKNSIVKSIIITPNPAQTSAAIQFSLLQRANVSIAIIDALGRNVASFGSSTYEEGAHSIPLDCKEFPHGILFARITSTSGETVTAKFIRE